ncbi:MAG: cytidine deaminase [Bacteroidota bacterium]|jgi:cytidine deaminase
MNPRKIILNTEFDEYDSSEQLSPLEQNLLKCAKESRDLAYAPYSNFYVGAALLLENNEIISGSNQENAAYPSGLCAERVAIFYSGAKYPNVKVKSLALSCNSKNSEVNKPLSPCGSCRQVIAETELRQGNKIRIIMSGNSGKIIACEGVENLLPLMFKGEFLEKK